MGLVELAMFPTLVVGFAVLARAGRPRPLPGWTDVLPVATVAWVVGIQGLLFRRQPDYMFGYLFEARLQPVATYLGWALLSLALASLVSFLFLRSRNATPPRPPLGALSLAAAAGLGAMLFWPRLAFIGSSLEMQQGILRPLAAQPAVRSLIVLTLIASYTPVLGAALLVAVDGLLTRARRP